MNEESTMFPAVVEVNVGGVLYTTSLETLRRYEESRLAAVFVGRQEAARDTKGRVFFDRDGVLFRYVLDFLRDGALALPDGFRERERLLREARHYQLPALEDAVSLATTAALSNTIAEASSGSGGGGGGFGGSANKGGRAPPGCITVGYRGSFAFGRDGLADVKFRKLSRILVSGRVSLCRDVFGETLNESRDPDHGLSERYTSRFFLKHSFLEQAFDMLAEQGFRLCGSCGSGTAGTGSTADLKPGMDAEENRWNHYNEFVFVRE